MLAKTHMGSDLTDVTLGHVCLDKMIEPTFHTPEWSLVGKQRETDHFEKSLPWELARAIGYKWGLLFWKNVKNPRGESFLPVLVHDEETERSSAATDWDLLNSWVVIVYLYTSISSVYLRKTRRSIEIVCLPPKSVRLTIIYHLFKKLCVCLNH